MVILKSCLLFVFFIILDEGLLALLIELALLKLPGHNNIISHPEAARQDYSERSGTHLSNLRLGFHPSAFSESFKGLLLWGLACEFVMALEQYNNQNITENSSFLVRKHHQLSGHEFEQTRR